MNKYIFIAGIFLILLGLAGCSLNIYEMGLPLVPTVTATRLPTRAPTATPTYPPKPEKSEGIIQTEQLESGFTRLVDTEFGYQVDFSPEWLVIGLDSGVQAQLASAFGEQIPESYTARVNSVQEVAGARAIVLDYTSYFGELGGANANIQLVFKADSDSSEQDVSTLTDSFVSAMPTQMPGANAIYQVVQTNPQGIAYGKLIVNHPSGPTGMPMKQMVALLKLADGLLTVTGSAVEEEFALVEMNFQQVLDSITLVP